jgi:putative ABC transport system substrate-binding protein
LWGHDQYDCDAAGDENDTDRLSQRHRSRSRGFVASLARPGGIIIGITPFECEIGGKWLQLLKEMAPGLTRVALLGDPENHNFKGFRKSFENYAKTIAIDPASVAVRSADDLERAIAAQSDGGRSGLIVSAATFSVTHRDLIVSLAASYKLPAIYWNRVSITRGGLMSYGPNIADLFR